MSKVTNGLKQYGVKIIPSFESEEEKVYKTPLVVATESDMP